MQKEKEFSYNSLSGRLLISSLKMLELEKHELIDYRTF